MMTAEKPKKRAWTPWYRLPIPPLCPNGHGAMIVNGTQETEGGLVIQYRKCPRCPETVTTTYRR